MDYLTVTKHNTNHLNHESFELRFKKCRLTYDAVLVSHVCLPGEVFVVEMHTL